MMSFRSLFLTIAMVSIMFTSCSKDDVVTDAPLGAYENGIIISHEGSTVPGSVSFVASDFTVTQNGVFKVVNGEDLGLFQQSIGFTDTKAYIVVDNANTITVVDRYTFKKQAAITEGIKTPRFITFSNGKGYVANWGDPGSATDDFVAIVDLATNKVESTISVSEGPEQLLVKEGTLYVSHKGGFNFNNVISVVNIGSKAVSEIVVGDNPDELILDTKGDLWVLCGGKTNFSTNDKTAGAIVKIDTVTNTVVDTLNFSGEEQPSLMAFDNGILYYTLENKIYQLKDASTLPGVEIVEASFYGMTIKDNKIYTVDAGDFASNGSLNIYDMDSNTWSTPIELGVVPSKIYFN